MVVPIFDDGYLAPAFCAEMERVMRGLLGEGSLARDFEVIFVNDGSRDASLGALLEVRERYDFVRVIDLSRNFGQHQAIACGLREAAGAVVLRANVDLQDEPAAIPRLLQVLQEDDADLVVGRYAQRRSPLLTRMSARMYYALFRLLTGFDCPQNTSPLRAMSRRFVTAYNTLTERARLPQGLDHWLGMRHRYVPIEHRARPDGRSSYTLPRRLQLALNGMFYFSDRPLRLMMFAGFVAAGMGFVTVLGVVGEKLAGVDILPGWASLTAIALLAFGIQIGCTGLVGLYIGLIFSEVQNRPLYVVRERYDCRAGPAAPEGNIP